MKHFFLLFLLFAAVYLIPLGSRPLVTPDEFRYALIPWEMLESGNYAAPHMFGLPYFEKPVLGHWWTAANLKIFGLNAFAIRLSSALSAGLSALIIGLMVFGASHDKRLSVLSGVLLLFCGMSYGVGVFSVLDSPVTFFSTGAMACAFGYLQKDTPRLRKILMLILCGIFCGLGFMVKGVPAWIVPCLGVAGFLICERRWKEFFIMPWLPLLCTALVILPWGLAVHRADPDFWRYFIEVEHLQRFTGSSAGQHPEPWYFLLPFFFGGVFPAAFLLVSGWGNVRGIIRLMRQQALYRYAFFCAVLPLILFSCSSGKLPTYILPCFPAVAVLIAGFTVTALRNFEKSERNLNLLFDILGYFFAIAGILSVVAGSVLPFLMEQCPELPPKTKYIVPLLLAAGASCAGSGSLLLVSRKKAIRSRLCFFAVLWALPALVVPFFISDGLNTYKMQENVLLRMQSQIGFRTDDVHIITIPSLMHAAAWSFKTPNVQLLDSIGEMKYGDSRAVRDGKRRMQMNEKEFLQLIRNPNRQDVLHIYLSNRIPVDVPGVKPEKSFFDPQISARFYPGKRASEGRGRK